MAGRLQTAEACEPNSETCEALEEPTGGLERFDTVDALLADLEN